MFNNVTNSMARVISCIDGNHLKNFVGIVSMMFFMIGESNCKMILGTSPCNFLVASLFHHHASNFFLFESLITSMPCLYLFLLFLPKSFKVPYLSGANGYDVRNCIIILLHLISIHKIILKLSIGAPTNSSS